MYHLSATVLMIIGSKDLQVYRTMYMHAHVKQLITLCTLKLIAIIKISL